MAALFVDVSGVGASGADDSGGGWWDDIGGDGSPDRCDGADCSALVSSVFAGPIARSE